MSRRDRVGSSAWVAVCTIALVLAVPTWSSRLGGLVSTPLGSPSTDAELWIERVVPTDSRVVVGLAMWVDLRRAGIPARDLRWYPASTADPPVAADAVSAWTAADYIVTSGRAPAAGSPERRAVADSVVVARFGTGTTAIAVRRVAPRGIGAATAALARSSAARTAADEALRSNPRVTLSLAAASELDAGRIDERAAVTLAGLGQSAEVVVAGAPAVPGETGPRRTLLLSSFAGAPLTPGSAASAAVSAALRSSAPAYAPQTVVQTARGLLATWSFDPIP